MSVLAEVIAESPLSIDKTPQTKVQSISLKIINVKLKIKEGNMRPTGTQLLDN